MMILILRLVRTRTWSRLLGICMSMTLWLICRRNLWWDWMMRAGSMILLRGWISGNLKYHSIKPQSHLYTKYLPKDIIVATSLQSTPKNPSTKLSTPPPYTPPTTKTNPSSHTSQRRWWRTGSKQNDYIYFLSILY